VRKKRAWSFGALIVAAVVATASLAGAQVVVPQRDGNPSPESGSNPQTAICGPNINSTVRTQNRPNTTNNVAFQPLAGAATYVNVPAGQSRCVKVVFTAESACGASAAPDFCYVQAEIAGVPMDPNGLGFQALDSEDATASAHAYEWVKRVGPGNHLVTVETAVSNAATAFYIDDWTFDVQVYQ
jgi:hypothetical protein